MPQRRGQPAWRLSRRSRVGLPEECSNRRGVATTMATVRFYRGHWVADYYDATKRRRIERHEGHFEKATQELHAAQVLLADRVAEVADGGRTPSSEAT